MKITILHCNNFNTFIVVFRFLKRYIYFYIEFTLFSMYFCNKVMSCIVVRQ